MSDSTHRKDRPNSRKNHPMKAGVNEAEAVIELTELVKDTTGIPTLHDVAEHAPRPVYMYDTTWGRHGLDRGLSMAGGLTADEFPDPGPTDLITDLQKVAEQLEKTPTMKEYKKHGSFKLSNILDRLGGPENWFRTYDQIEPRYNAPNTSTETEADSEKETPDEREGNYRISDEELKNDLRRVREEVGEIPSEAEYRDKGEYSPQTISRRLSLTRPSWGRAVQNVFGHGDGSLECPGCGDIYPTWESLQSHINLHCDQADPDDLDDVDGGKYVCDQCGHESPSKGGLKGHIRLAHETNGVGQGKNITKGELEADVRRVAIEAGRRPPMTTDYQEYGQFSTGTVTNRFGGGWNDSMQEIFDPDEHVDAKAACRDLRKVTSDLGHPPTRKEYDEHGEHDSEAVIYASLEWDDWPDLVQHVFQTDPGPDSEEGDEDEQEEVVGPTDIKIDLYDVSNAIGVPPTPNKYREHGQYSLEQVRDSCGTYAEALGVAGFRLETVAMSMATEILKDLAHEQETIPTRDDVVAELPDGFDADLVVDDENWRNLVYSTLVKRSY